MELPKYLTSTFALKLTIYLKSDRNSVSHFLFLFTISVSLFQFGQVWYCWTGTLREKCPNTKFFLVCFFPHSHWIRRIRRDTRYLSVFSPNAEKYGPGKTSYLDTFHAVGVKEIITIQKRIKCKNPNNNEEKWRWKTNFLFQSPIIVTFMSCKSLTLGDLKYIHCRRNYQYFFVYCVTYTPWSNYFEKWNKQFFWWTLEGMGEGGGEINAIVIPCHTLWICIALVHLHRALKNLSISRKKASQMSWLRIN